MYILFNIIQENTFTYKYMYKKSSIILEMYLTEEKSAKHTL